MRAIKQNKIPSFPSTSEVLPSLISSAQARHILKRQRDTREVFEQVANIRGQSEAELMAELGSIVGLPCAEVINRSAIETPWDGEFLKYGALPEVINGSVVGAYCIDPYRIRHLIPSDLCQSIVLVPWGLLRSFAIKVPPAELSLTRTTKSEPSSGLATLLELILDEAKSLGRNTVALSITTRGISYEFQMDDGELLTGLIEGSSDTNGSEIEDLAKQPNTITLNGGSRVTLTKDALGRFILAERVEEPLDQSSALAREPRKIKKILLIEDDPTFSAIVSEVLVTSGYHVTAASSLSEALSLLKEQTEPDAIISDLNIADSSGVDTVARLLAEKIVQPELIVVLSNEDDGQLEASLLRLGVRGVIAKNRDPEVLLAYLDQMLELTDRATGES